MSAVARWGVLLLLLFGMLYAYEKSFVDLRPPLPPGPEWASKAAMQNVKTALVNLRADMGRVPHLGGAADYDDAHVNGADAVLDLAADRNVLCTSEVKGVSGWRMMGISVPQWRRQWRGPYLDGEPGEFMLDGWKRRIHLRVFRGYAYLWSAGADGRFDDLGQVVRNLATQSDDIVMSVTRLVGPGFATNTLACPPDWDYVAPLNVDQPMAGDTGAKSAR